MKAVLLRWDRRLFTVGKYTLVTSHIAAYFKWCQSGVSTGILRARQGPKISRSHRPTLTEQLIVLKKSKSWKHRYVCSLPLTLWIHCQSIIDSSLMQLEMDSLCHIKKKEQKH